MKNIICTLTAAAALWSLGASAQQQVFGGDGNTATKREFISKARAAAHKKTAPSVKSPRLLAEASLPYFEGFDDEDAFGTFTVLDENFDFATWEYNDEGYAEYSALFQDEDENADDWLISPSVHLEAGKNYQISFRACVFLSEELSVWLGTSADDADEMTIEVMPATTLENEEFATFTYLVSVPEDGDYHLGFHCTSPGEDTYSLMIDDIAIAEGAQGAVPAAVTGLTVTAAPLGELSATIAFTAPTLALDGSTLAAIDYITVSRDGDEVSRLDAPAPGSALSVTDNGPKNGWNSYSVVAYANSQAGETATVQAFIGVDVPMTPALSVRSQGSDVIIGWEVSEEGWNGRYVNPDAVTVDIWETPDGISRTAVATGVTGKEYVYTGRNAGAQSLAAYQVVVSNVAGNSQRVTSDAIVVGAPYELPFNESVSGGTLDNAFWAIDRTNSNDVLMATRDDSFVQDGDGGALLLRSNNEETVKTDFLQAQTGKINISSAEKPVLRFFHMSAAEGNSTLSVAIERDGKVLASFDTKSYQGASGQWNRELFDLSTVNDGEPIRVLFTVQFGSGKNDVYIDNITVCDLNVSAITDIADDSSAAPTRYYTIDGHAVAGTPSQPGIYIVTNGSTAGKIIIR